MNANPDIDLKAAHQDTRGLVEQRTAVVLSAMQHEPKSGGRFLYSNLSYIVIGAAIDRLTDTSYEEALSHYVLQPLGIESAGYGTPPVICGHSARLRLGSLQLFCGNPVFPEKDIGDNPPVLSSAGTLYLTMSDWAKFLTLFLTRGNDLLTAESIDYLLRRPEGSGDGMTKGWIEAKGMNSVSFGMQGSNTLWAATALMDSERSRTGLVLCNDGRTRVITASARLASDLLTQDNRK